MTISERVTLINDLYRLARNEKLRDGVNINSVYLTIDDNNRVGVWPLATNTVFNGNNLTICCIDLTYLSYGWQTYREVFTILDKEGNIMNSIHLTNWGMTFGFRETRQPREPIAAIEIFHNIDPGKKIKLITYSDMGYQEIWNYFLEMNENCTTLSEADIYFKYFESRFENNNYELNFLQYKNELSAKDDLITQYKTLLDSIKNLVEKQ